MNWTLEKKHGESAWVRLDGVQTSLASLKHDLDQAVFRFDTMRKLLAESGEFGSERELLAQLSESIELMRAFTKGFPSDWSPRQKAG